MKNHFEWKNVLRFDEQRYRVSLVQHVDHMTLFWAALREDGELFRPIMLNKERVGYQTLEESLSLQDAKMAVEKKLFDDGILHEGDEIVDQTI